MNEMPLIIKFAEVAIMEILVGIAVVAFLVVAVRDIVESRLQEARRRDQIALEAETKKAPAAQPAVEPTPVTQTVQVIS